ncbi:sensor histidine kinase [Streptomyces sp. DSM 44917]|uniref:histidine kinase n=1 Tax=Streptomyces boetiae TaxID=3075541 RepID=A0ABU2LBM9_9ACTN|nr:sensor histidine kinase [Streptomyces sp. DSM 44917]MDT0308922.1 sensor histidine kinase [Streptomyces sp. DSM 44917]
MDGAHDDPGARREGAARRGSGAPLLPFLLLAAAVAEAVLRAERADAAVLSAALATALGAAAPLAFARARPRTAAAVATLAAALSVPFLRGPGPLATGLLAALAAWLLLARGEVRRARAARAARDASRLAFETTLTELTARGERARIARELHDVVAHHISMISVQAETARLTTPGMPEEGARRLLAIGDTARTALTEMRRLLGVLREDAGEEPARRGPQPGLAQLLELLDETRESAAGGHVRLILSGRAVPLGPGVELTAYRIVQEALTNARRHAPGAAVDVALAWAGDGLRVRVRDNGPGPPPGPAAPGHGLLGMRERVAALGGDLRAGRDPAGGFAVEALLPARTEAAA